MLGTPQTDYCRVQPAGGRELKQLAANSYLYVDLSPGACLSQPLLQRLVISSSHRNTSIVRRLVDGHEIQTDAVSRSKEISVMDRVLSWGSADGKRFSTEAQPYQRALRAG